MQQPIHTRFAPTPSGYLHIGNAYSFILTWLMARKSGGTVRLRIDDIDAERVRTEFIEDIFQNLDWLGLDYDVGPQGVDDFYQNHSQQLRLERYNTFLTELKENNRVFACCCSRKNVLDNAINGQYNGHCLNLHLPLNTPDANLRFITKQEESSAKFTDVWADYGSIDLYQHMRYFVVAGRNGNPAYQLASVVDDVDYNINFIVRGSDLLYSTAAQYLLAQSLNGLSPFLSTTFLHHGLITNANGEKLSKSAGDTSLKFMRENGESASSLYLSIAQRMGLPPCTSAQEMLAVWDK